MTPVARRVALVFLLLAGIGAALYWRDRLSTGALTAWVAQLGLLAPLVFTGCYAFATVLFLPGLLFTLAGGALFGPVYGTLYSLTGATLGATLAFLAVRYLAQNRVAQRAGGRLRALVEGVEQEGWRCVAFVRLMPLFPFILLHHALGLTRIRLSHYVISSFVLMALGGAAYTCLGYAGRGLAGGGQDVLRKVLLALAVVATLTLASRPVLRLPRGRAG
jgi:uncharacterized membrane protein YdjX (TVP38/TMEM64 family)